MERLGHSGYAEGDHPRSSSHKTVLRETTQKCVSYKIILVQGVDNLLYLPALSALKTITSDLAQEVHDCFYALSALEGKLDAHTEPGPTAETEHSVHLNKQSGSRSLLSSTTTVITLFYVVQLTMKP